MSKGDRLDRGRTQRCSMVMENLAVPLVVLVLLIILLLVVLVVLVVLVALVLLVILVILVILIILILAALVGRGSEVQFEPADPPDMYGNPVQEQPQTGELGQPRCTDLIPRTKNSQLLKLEGSIRPSKCNPHRLEICHRSERISEMPTTLLEEGMKPGCPTLTHLLEAHDCGQAAGESFLELCRDPLPAHRLVQVLFLAVWEPFLRAQARGENIICHNADVCSVSASSGAAAASGCPLPASQAERGQVAG
jgi:hypothetical protein